MKKYEDDKIVLLRIERMLSLILTFLILIISAGWFYLVFKIGYYCGR